MRAMCELGELASGAVSTERLTPARKSTMIESVNACPPVNLVGAKTRCLR
ncbi:hypothetical protein CIW59_16440 [Enterobacter roggenkampii]|nr:hypothetical protein CIW59_16440 [Enterobacter roggenkampii]